jgi:hypothetical protein
MNWEEVGAIGQVLGSVAVFITLVYLAIQTRHAKDASQRVVSQSRGEALRHAYEWASEPRMVAISIKASTALGLEPNPFIARLMGEVGLTHEEAATRFLYELAGWQYRVQMITAMVGMSSIERHGFDRTLVTGYGADRGVGRMFYDWMKPTASPGAVRYIEEVLARDRGTNR